MANLQFLLKFYTHPTTITILSITISLITIALLYYFYGDRIALRKKALMTSVLLSTFLWMFIVLSIVLCTVYEREYLAYPLRVIKIIGSVSAISALFLSSLLSFIVYRKASQYFLRNISLTRFSKKERRSMDKIRANPNIPKSIYFKKINKEIINAFSITGEENIIFLSKGLLEKLNYNELEAVVLHEVSHIMNKDSIINIYLSIMAQIIFFDPILRFVKNNINREIEMIADEYSIKYMQNKFFLLSALNKINKYYLNNNTTILPSIFIVKNEKNYITERINHINSM